MKKTFVVFAALLVAACAGKPATPCLQPDEPGRILSIENWQEGGRSFVDIKLTTDNKTVRVCRASVPDVNQLKVGDIIVGYDGDTYAGFGYDWWRVR